MLMMRDRFENSELPVAGGTRTLTAAGIVFALVMSGGAAMLACGPFFPNTVLDRPDITVKSAPVADFCSEIDRLVSPAKLQTRKPMSPGGRERRSSREIDANIPPESTAGKDLADLRLALAEQKLPHSEKLAENYAHFRKAILQAQEQAEEAREEGKKSVVRLENLQVPAGLPAEFEQYARGAVAYHQGKADEARKCWQAVLDLPAERRKYRTVWAAYMIGRSLVDSEPRSAIEWLKKTRQLAKEGFFDSMDLATASLGWQGRAELKQGNFRQAIELYMQQYPEGMAGMSLRDTAAKAFGEGPEELNKLVNDPACRGVLTAYVVARGGPYASWTRSDDPNEDSGSPTRVWLKTIEAARVNDVRGADRLAWAAYQSGDMKTAKRWLERARVDSPIAQWLTAKLLSREGRLDKAAAILAGMVQELPTLKSSELQISDMDSGVDGDRYSVAVPVRVVAGELAVLKMARSQYVEALDLLMQHNYWFDAAYVAERVLTPEELIAYVDKNWPARLAEGWKPGDRSPSGSSGWTESMLEDSMAGRGTEGDQDTPEIRKERKKILEHERTMKAHDIRHLLARRLVRLGRWKDARPYFPPSMQEKLDAYIGGIRAGADESLGNEKRAAALMESARLARFWGMALMGTELRPDYVIHEGQYGADGEEPAESRFTEEEGKLAGGTSDEKERFANSKLNPSRRFHYRYVAADHAWNAIQLMPDNFDDTAKACCEAGWWIKSRDPKAADRFYKALVTKCGQTALGKEAAQKHWFPSSYKPPRQGKAGEGEEKGDGKDSAASAPAPRAEK